MEQGSVPVMEASVDVVRTQCQGRTSHFERQGQACLFVVENLAGHDAWVSQDVVVIHTDGGCTPNPGPGGWGAVLRHGESARELFGGEPGETTNNRMELMATIMALEALKRSVTVHLHTDSTYVRNGITKWVLAWEKNGWKTSAKQPVKNVDLWQRLQAACAQHEVEWFWVKGHVGIPDNELADELATKGMLEAMAR